MFSINAGGQLKGYSLVTARVGSTALIPCNLTIKPTVDDFVTLILWFKDDMGGAPIFTIDARSRSLGSAPHVPNALLEGRASFDLKSQPAFLKIHPVMKEDDGLYKCRIDYRRGRTVSTTTYLTIVGKLCTPLYTVPSTVYSSIPLILPSPSPSSFITIALHHATHVPSPTSVGVMQSF